MAVKIRLMRIGTNRKPFYRVVAVDERKKRTGGYLELLGTYNPLTEPKEILLQQDKIDAWIKKGAVPSYGFLRIIGKAPQRKARKAKKPARNASQSDAGGEKKETPAAAPATPTETQAAETPVENAQAPVTREESIKEAPMPEPAAAAAPAEVLETKTEETPAVETPSEQSAPEEAEAKTEETPEEKSEDQTEKSDS